MYKKLFNIKITITAAMLLIAFAASAQPKNLTVKIYGPRSLDVTVLDARFDDVIVDGAVRTADYTGNTDWRTLPTDVSGFGGVQMLVIGGSGYNYYANQWGRVSIAQADALVQFVKNGGVLVSAFNGVYVGPVNDFSKEINEYLAEQLMPGTDINPVAASPSLPMGANPPNVFYPVPAYHNGTGPLGLYTNSNTKVYSGTVATTYRNVPSASAVYGGMNKPTGNCSQFHVLEFVAPSYPGSATALANNVRGFAYLSGEPAGGTMSIGNFPPYGTNNDGDNNKNLAGLIYDYLYNPAGMVTRRAWSSNSANINNACPPTTFTSECPTGTQTKPTVTSPATNTCPSTTVNLNNHAAAAPTGTQLVWYTTANRTAGTQVANPGAVSTSGTYYAFYQGTGAGFTNCYSPASDPVTVTITSPCPCNAGSAAPVVHSAVPSNGQTVNLNDFVTPHSNPYVEARWFFDANHTNAVSGSIVTATSTPTNYWVFYFDASNNCYSTAGTKVVVVSNANCTNPTVNLTTLPHETLPAGTQLVWFKDNAHTQPVTDPTAVAENGTYWPFIFDSNNNCYSPAGTPVIVALDNCAISCTKPGATGTALTSSVGILIKGSNPSVTNWPQSVPNGYLVLDGVFKGMVVTQMTTAQVNALAPVEGMLVFDTDAACLKLYRGTSPGVNPARTGWVCIERVCLN